MNICYIINRYKRYFDWRVLFMHATVEEVVRNDQLNVHFIQTKKFKTLNFVCKFRAPLRRETVTKRALLPYILQQGTKSYPSEKELQMKLNQLYGAVLSIDATKKGNSHIISVRFELANQKYIQEESSLLEEAISLLKEIIYHPLTTGNNAFYEKTFDREKETLRKKMQAIVDDKMAYANMRLIDEMFKGEPYALHVHGYEEDLQEITAQNTYEYYQSLLKDDQLDLYVLGDFNEEHMYEQLLTYFQSHKSHFQEIENTKKERIQDVHTVIDRQQVQQAKLHIGYRTNCSFQDDAYFALQVFNGLFGGFPSSKLFLNVREKHSLAYYAASRLESHVGLLLVFSGIDTGDYQQAREIIEDQLQAMQRGDFTESDVQETKDMIANQLLETMDHPQGIVELLYQQVLGNKKRSPELFIQSIRKVTKEEVVQIANKIEEDTVYLLTNTGGDHRE